MGDMLSLIEKAQENYDEKQAEDLEKKIRKNEFTLEDFLEQMGQIKKMGGLGKIIDMLPGMGGQRPSDEDMEKSEKEFVRMEAIISSMTKEERRDPKILNASRKRRIAAGCGLQVVDVNRLLKQFDMMQQLTKQMTRGRLSKMGGGGLGSRMHGFGRKKRLK